MVLNKIEKLLEKYENGETSLAEEQELKDYFSQDTVANHLEKYQPMFKYFEMNKKEEFTKGVPFPNKRTINYKWISVAAVALIMLGFYVSKSYKANDLGTIKDPELAFDEISKSLEMISNHFNKGASTVGYLGEVEDATSIIFKSNH